MPTCDLHVHTTASTDRIRTLGDWPIHPTLGPQESYLLAKQRGMDYVTFTDHDTIDGCLTLERERGRLPDDFFISVEISSRDPQTKHSVHVNAYGITPQQHDESQRLRDDLSALQAYLREQGIVFGWNHPVWDDGNRPAPMEDLRRIARGFDIIEVRNGTRRERLNGIAELLASELDKGRTAGSDSHTDGIGTTWTEAPGETVTAYLASVNAGSGEASGDHGTREKFTRDAQLLAQAAFKSIGDDRESRVARFAVGFARRAVSALVPPAVRAYHYAQDRSLRSVYA